MKSVISLLFEYERNRLAELCKMGDVVAMYDMALHLLSNCTDEQKALVYKYESNPCEKTKHAISEYICSHKSFYDFEYYMMWVVRAAIYGNEKAGALLNKCDYYRFQAYIPEEYYDNNKRLTSRHFSLSDELYKIGFCDMIMGKTGCDLCFRKDLGYFQFAYVSDYLPPDDDGFGSETDYEHIYFDEFFKRIPVPPDASEEEVLLGLKKVEAEREAFWQAQDNSDERKYKRLIRSNK